RGGVDAVEVEEVEHDVDDRDLGGAPQRLVAIGDVHAVLEAAEVGADAVERDDLAVEDDRGAVEVASEALELREARDHGEAARADTADAAADAGDHPHPVPLDLVGPAVVVVGQRPGDGLHRLREVDHDPSERTAVHAGRMRAWPTPSRSLPTPTCPSS